MEGEDDWDGLLDDVDIESDDAEEDTNQPEEIQQQIVDQVAGIQKVYEGLFKLELGKGLRVQVVWFLT